MTIFFVGKFMTGQPNPPLTYPPRNNGLIRPYYIRETNDFLFWEVVIWLAGP